MIRTALVLALAAAASAQQPPAQPKLYNTVIQKLKEGKQVFSWTQTKFDIKEYCEKEKSAKYVPGGNVWEVPCQVAMPSATQNEINGKDAALLVKNGCIAVGEGANMPTTPEGVRVLSSSTRNSLSEVRTRSMPMMCE